MQGRFVFYNPHTSVVIKKTFYIFYTRKKAFNKYAYLLDYCLDNNIPIGFCTDGTDASAFKKYFRTKIGSRIELWLWCFINKINPLKVKFYSSVNQLSNNDTLFTFLYGNFFPTYGSKNEEDFIKKRVAEFSTCKAYKVLHVTHFFLHASSANDNIKNAKIDLCVAENNLTKNSEFFKEYFTSYQKEVYNLPFVPQNRFQYKTPFNERENMAVATGTMMFKLKDKDFLAMYPDGILHPMRKMIYDNKETLKSQIDCFINTIEDQVAEKEKLITNKSFFQKVYGTIIMTFFHKQAAYFSFDIVALYNKYKMFIVPEENVGLPGIGMAEGMACGCVYIGKADPMYSDIGMIDGENFIAYDGTMEDLKHKISFYQNNPEKLGIIAENSLNFVQNKLNANVVSSAFLKSINEYAKNN